MIASCSCPGSSDSKYPQRVHKYPLGDTKEEAYRQNKVTTLKGSQSRAKRTLLGICPNTAESDMVSPIFGRNSSLGLDAVTLTSRDT